MPDKFDWKNTSIPLGFLAAILVTAGPAVHWFNDYHAGFITSAEANEQIERKLGELEAKVEENTDTTIELKKEFRIRFALQRVEALEARLYVLQRDQADPDLVYDVEGDLDRASAYSDCLIDDRPNCQHLEPGRTR
jgi:hypothetical protein